MTQITMNKVRLYSIYTIVAVIAGLVGAGGSYYYWLGIFTDTISRTQADNILSNYLKETDLLKLTDHTFGGTFPKDSVYTSDPRDRSVGVRFWFCYNPAGNPKVFLAGERLHSFTFPTTSDEPQDSMLFTVDASFSYGGTLGGGGTVVMDYLEHNPIPLPASTLTQVSKAEVITYANNFRQLVSGMPHYLDYNFTFFIYDNTKDFEKFFAQPGMTHVRYFFGFDNSDAVNKIRVALVGVDATGRNLVGTNSVILQKSIPPPPDL